MLLLLLYTAADVLRHMICQVWTIWDGDDVGSLFTSTWLMQLLRLLLLTLILALVHETHMAKCVSVDRGKSTFP